MLFIVQTLDAHLHQISSLIVELMSLQRKIKSKKMKGEYRHQKLCWKNKSNVANQHRHGLNA